MLTTTLSFDQAGLAGANPANVIQVNNMDVAPDNAYAENGTRATENKLLNDANFGGISNRDISSVNLTHGIIDNLVDPAGGEFTVVGRLKEVVVSAAAGTVTNKVVADPNNFIEIWYDKDPVLPQPATAANPLAGTGYNDGKRIFFAGVGPTGLLSDTVFTQTAPAPGLPLDHSPTPAPADNNYVGVNSVLGNGSALVGGNAVSIISVDPDFFLDPPGLINVNSFFVGLAANFTQVNPSNAFVTTPSPDGTTSTGSDPNNLAGDDRVSQSNPAGDPAPMADKGVGIVNGDFQSTFPLGPGQGGPDFMFQTDTTVSFFVDEPSIQIEKAINAVDPLNPTAAEDADTATGPVLEAGTPVTWTYLVTNTGDTALDITSIVDDFDGNPIFVPLFVSGDNGNGLLDVGETWLYTSSGVAGQPHLVVPGQFMNTATVVANPVDDTGADLPGADDVNDDDPNHHFGVDAKIEINPPEDTNPVNTNHDMTVTVMTVGGNLAAGGASIDSTLVGVGSIISPDPTNTDGAGTPTGNALVTITSAVAGVSTVSSTGTIPIDVDGDTVADITLMRTTDGSVTPSGLQNSDPAIKNWGMPAIQIEKAINAVDPLNPTAAEDADTPTGPVLEAGTPVTWTYLVTNTGTTVLDITSIVDDFDGNPGFVPLFVSGDDGNGLLDVGETWLYTSSGVTGQPHLVVPFQFMNTATVVGNPVDSGGGDLPGFVDVNDDDPNHHFGVDAKIEINPPVDTNPVNTNHDMTVTVMTVGGNLAAGGANIDSTLVGVGSIISPDPTNTDGAGTPTGNALVTITSAVAGVSTVSSTGTIPIDVDGDTVADITLIRTTNGSLTPSGLQNSDAAIKNWEQPLDGRMTGGGSVFIEQGGPGRKDDLRVTHGFELHCNPLIQPQNLEINYDGNQFHLNEVLESQCYDTEIEQLPRSAPIDTYAGLGGPDSFALGRGKWRVHGQPVDHDASIMFRLTDGGHPAPRRGEPGRDDVAHFIIEVDGLEVANILTFGNHQAHPENKKFPALATVSGDANLDGRFDRHDLVHVLQRGKFLTGELATWNDGDWNGDFVFNQLDLVAALQTGGYTDNVATDSAFQELGNDAEELLFGSVL